MELHRKPHQNHVSPTKHKVFMHTNSMPTFIPNHPIDFHTKIKPNSSFPTHYVIYNTYKASYMTL